MDINEKLQFWNKEIERAREYDFYFDPGSVAEVVKECEKQQQKIEGLEEQANEMAEKHAEKDIIMGNMQKEIERLKKELKIAELGEFFGS